MGGRSSAVTANDYEHRPVEREKSYLHFGRGSLAFALRRSVFLFGAADFFVPAGLPAFLFGSTGSVLSTGCAFAFVAAAGSNSFGVETKVRDHTGRVAARDRDPRRMFALDNAGSAPRDTTR